MLESKKIFIWFNKFAYLEEYKSYIALERLGIGVVLLVIYIYIYIYIPSINFCVLAIRICEKGFCLVL